MYVKVTINSARPFETLASFKWNVLQITIYFCYLLSEAANGFKYLFNRRGGSKGVGGKLDEGAGRKYYEESITNLHPA